MSANTGFMTTPICAYCKRPVVNPVVYVGMEIYHPECVHGQHIPLTFQKIQEPMTVEMVRQIVREELKRMASA